MNTHIFGNDEAYYIRRPALAGGKWSNWNEVRALHPLNPTKGEFHSFAPSVALDESGDVAIAAVFFDTTDGEHLLDYDARILRNGSVEGASIVLSQLARITAAGEKTTRRFKQLVSRRRTAAFSSLEWPRLAGRTDDRGDA